MREQGQLDLKTQSIQLEYKMHKRSQAPQLNFSGNKITAKGTASTLTIKEQQQQLVTAASARPTQMTRFIILLAMKTNPSAHRVQHAFFSCRFLINMACFSKIRYRREIKSGK
jgi:hypothetical protein